MVFESTLSWLEVSYHVGSVLEIFEVHTSLFADRLMYFLVNLLDFNCLI